MTVVVDGWDVATARSTFYYDPNNAPSLGLVFPDAGPPGTLISLLGDGGNKLGSDCAAADVQGTVDCIGTIHVGDNVCRQLSDQDDSSVYSPASYDQTDISYRLQCLAPAPTVTGTDDGGLLLSTGTAGIGVAGNKNVTVSFERSQRGGRPVPDRSSYSTAVDGSIRQFQLHAELDAVSPALGSTAGGTVLTISGRGFPSYPPPGVLDQAATIDVVLPGGAPCTLLTSNYSTITCVTAPQPAAGIAAPAPAVAGVYAGMRGIEYEYLNVSAVNATVDMSNVTALGSGQLAVEALPGSFRARTTGSWHHTNDESAGTGPHSCLKSRSVFVAPVAGNYSFLLNVNDFGNLYGTFKQVCMVCPRVVFVRPSNVFSPLSARRLP